MFLDNFSFFGHHNGSWKKKRLCLSCYVCQKTRQAACGTFLLYLSPLSVAPRAITEHKLQPSLHTVHASYESHRPSSSSVISPFLVAVFQLPTQADILLNNGLYLEDDQIVCQQTFSTLSVSSNPILRVTPSTEADHLPLCPPPAFEQGFSILWDTIPQPLKFWPFVLHRTIPVYYLGAWCQPGARAL